MGRKPKKILDASISPSKLPPPLRALPPGQERHLRPPLREFLTLVDQSNSMQTACKEMEMSYSKGLEDHQKAEEYLGCSLIESPVWRRNRRLFPI